MRAKDILHRTNYFKTYKIHANKSANFNGRVLKITGSRSVLVGTVKNLIHYYNYL